MRYPEPQSLMETPIGFPQSRSASIGPQEFRFLKRRRSIEKQLLPFLKTTVDFDIVCEVGFHELSREPLTVKHLILLGLAPQMTVFRRLNRLCDLGVIVRSRAPRDGRVHELRLASSVHPLLLRYACMSHPAGDDSLSVMKPWRGG